MNHFFKKIITFIIIPMFFGLLILLISNQLVKTNHTFNTNVRTIFIGDSHIQASIIDSIVPYSKNVGISSESYYFTFYKLKSLLKDNPSIKNVYLGLSFHNLSFYYNSVIMGEYSPSITPKYFFILPLTEQVRLIYWNRLNLSVFIKELIKNDNKKLNFIGGYDNIFNETVAVDSSMNKRLQTQFYENKNPDLFSEINIQYLSKIATLCKKNNVNLFVLNTPLHRDYYKKVPKEYIEKLNEIVNQNKLVFIDLSNLELTENCYAPDGDHVSVKGSVNMSRKIKEIVQNQAID
ncbi:MAG: hypothetical protein IT232_08145 [Flavobacteriales bacterium]|nr:hypothetical protein [Flavobacteriales bacterium]